MGAIENIPNELKALHTYFTRASAIREDYVRCAKEVKATSTDEGVDLLALMEADRRMSVYYGLVYVVVEGCKDAGVSDTQLEALFADPLMEKLRRYRNAIFHYQKEHFVGDKHMDFHADSDAPAFMTRLWKELNRWFSVNITAPVLRETGTKE